MSISYSHILIFLTSLAASTYGLEKEKSFSLSKQARRNLIRTMPDLDRSHFKDAASKPENYDAFSKQKKSTTDIKIIQAGKNNPIELPFALQTSSKTETEKNKIKEIRSFFSKQIEDSTKPNYNSYDSFTLLLKRHRSYFTLMVQQPLFQDFINNRINAKDASTLFNLASVIFRAARPQDDKGIALCAPLAQKALEILVKIESLDNLDLHIKKDIQIFIEQLSTERPFLYDHYLKLQAKDQILPSRKTGWLEEAKNLFFRKSDSSAPPEESIPHIKQSHINSDAAIPAFPSISSTIENSSTCIPSVQEPSLSIEKNAPKLNIKKKHKKKTIATIPQPSTESVILKPVDIQKLFVESKRLYVAKQFHESAQKAWMIIKASDPATTDYKHAANHIERISRLDQIESLHMMSILHINDPHTAIGYFMKAMSHTRNTLDEEPVQTSSSTLTTLLNKSIRLTFNQPEVIEESVMKIMELADGDNQEACQAIAIYYHKIAAANPTMQLQCLCAAKHYLQKLLPLEKKLPSLLEFNPKQIFFDFYQQLYVFARNDDNYKKDGVLQLPYYYIATCHLAEALTGLNIQNNLPNAQDWITQANFSLRQNLYTIQQKLNANINEIIKSSFINSMHAIAKSVQEDMLIYGAYGLPLSIKQRNNIVWALPKHSPDSTLILSLNAKKFEASPYYNAALEEKKPYSIDYYRMLFELDSKNINTAFQCARNAAKLGDARADIFLRNIPLSTDLIFKNNESKIASIKVLFKDITDPKKIKNLIILYCDAIEILEELASRNYLPAIELLIDVHTTYDNSSHYHRNRIIHLLYQAKSILMGSAKYDPNYLLFSKEYYQKIGSFCQLNATLEPVYAYVDCLLAYSKYLKCSEQAEFTIYYLNLMLKGIQVDQLKEEKYQIFNKDGACRTQLTTHLKELVTDHSSMTHLQNIEAYDAVLNLYFHLCPEDSHATFGTDMAEKITNKFIIDFLNPLLEFEVVEGNPSNQLKPEELTDALGMRQTLAHFRKTNTSKQYKHFHTCKPFPIGIDFESIPTQVSIEFIEKIIARMGHEFLIAQADSTSPLKPFEIPIVKEYFEKAVSHSPDLAHTMIANEFIIDDYWPQDIVLAREHLNIALDIMHKKEINTYPALGTLLMEITKKIKFATKILLNSVES